MSSSAYSSMEDRELLQRHLAGEEAALATLIERYQVELFNFLARFTGNTELAEDIFQDTFLQLHLSAATFDMDRRLKPWLFTIAANKARDALRKKSRRPALPLDAEVSSGTEGNTTYAELIPSNIPSPDENILNLETRQAVQRVVQEMPENLRTVLLLNYFQEFPYQEIAEMLNLPLGTVKSRLHTAVKQFAQRWKAISERNGHDESSE